MLTLTIMKPIVIADQGEDAKKGTSSVQPNALIVMTEDPEARALPAPPPRCPHPISRVGHAHLHPARLPMRPAVLELNISTCHPVQVVPEMATRLAQLKLRLRRRTYQSSVDSVVPQPGLTPRHSAGRVVLHA